MESIRFERLKLILVYALMAACAVQVAIIWNDGLHGFPARFFFGENAVVLAGEARFESEREMLAPVSLHITYDGHGDRREVRAWGEALSLAWSGVRGILRSSVGRAPDEVLGASKWPAITKAKGMAFRYGFEVPSELFLWSLGISGSYRDVIPGVREVFLRLDGAGRRGASVFLLGGGEAYRYDVVLTADEMAELDWLWLSLNAEADPVLLSSVSSYFPTSSFGGDIYTCFYGQGEISLVGMTVPLSNALRIGGCVALVPDALSRGGLRSPEGVGALADAILRDDQDSYVRSIDPKGDRLELKTQNDIYRVYADGAISYRYISGERGEAMGSMVLAYEKAMRMMGRLAALSDGVYMRLVGAEAMKGSTGDYYEFKFGYYHVGDGIRVSGDGLEAIALARSSGVMVASYRCVSVRQADAGAIYDVSYSAMMDGAAASIGPFFGGAAVERLYLTHRVIVGPVEGGHGVDYVPGPHWALEDKAGRTLLTPVAEATAP
ncbi:MAG: hypothetical protein FWE70_03810 [Oscillospiraceae bacterium]|nr:hypothetical protein [Oscillospiraceae bacterium]